MVCLLGGGRSRGEVGDFLIIYKTERSISPAGRDGIWRSEFAATSTAFREINTAECNHHQRHSARVCSSLYVFLTEQIVVAVGLYLGSTRNESTRRPLSRLRV